MPGWFDDGSEQESQLRRAAAATVATAPRIKPIDIERAKRGAKQVYMRGIPHTQERKLLIEEAITRIISDPSGALSKGYIGFKNYSGFGDQRTDCEYGMGPHGSMVFEIGATARNSHEPFDSDAIYYLECERDFAVYPAEGGQRVSGYDPDAHQRNLWERNLWDTLALHSSRTAALKRVSDHLAAATVEEEASH